MRKAKRKEGGVAGKKKGKKKLTPQALDISGAALPGKQKPWQPGPLTHLKAPIRPALSDRYQRARTDHVVSRGQRDGMEEDEDEKVAFILLLVVKFAALCQKMCESTGTHSQP